MPAQDVIHNAVKTALIKDGWTITHDPLFIRIKGIHLKLIICDIEEEVIVKWQT